MKNIEKTVRSLLVGVLALSACAFAGCSTLTDSAEAEAGRHHRRDERAAGALHVPHAHGEAGAGRHQRLLGQTRLIRQGDGHGLAAVAGALGLPLRGERRALFDRHIVDLLS